VLDTRLRVPAAAQVLAPHTAPTLIITSTRSLAERRDELRAHGVGVQVVDTEPPWGVDLGAALALLREAGIRSLLVEGGGAVITSFLRQHLADRVVVGIAPTILGAGTDAVGDLSAARVSDGLRLTGRSIHVLGDDVVMAGDVV
jgi:riboflavin biosynthesis pyrimidine reductase